MNKSKNILSIFAILPLLLQMTGFAYLFHSSCEMECCKPVAKQHSCCQMESETSAAADQNTAITKCGCQHEQLGKTEYLNSSHNYEKDLKIICLTNDLQLVPALIYTELNQNTFFGKSTLSDKIFLRNSILLI